MQINHIWLLDYYLAVSSRRDSSYSLVPASACGPSLVPPPPPLWENKRLEWKDTEGRKEMFYLTTHSTHFIYGYMASDIWLRAIPIVRKETRCCHIGYSFRLTARVISYAPSHRQDSTYQGLCYTSRTSLAGMRNGSIGHPMKDRSDDPSHHERTLLPRSYISEIYGHSIYQTSNV